MSSIFRFRVNQSNFWSKVLQSNSEPRQPILLKKLILNVRDFITLDTKNEQSIHPWCSVAMRRVKKVPKKKFKKSNFFYSTRCYAIPRMYRLLIFGVQSDEVTDIKN
jgi:hypothetical protein